jgi:hypothetical protein
MEPCRACAEKRLFHTETDAEKDAKKKTQLAPQTDMWYTLNHHTHTKRKTVYPSSFL